MDWPVDLQIFHFGPAPSPSQPVLPSPMPSCHYPCLPPLLGLSPSSAHHPVTTGSRCRRLSTKLPRSGHPLTIFSTSSPTQSAIATIFSSFPSTAIFPIMLLHHLFLEPPPPQSPTVAPLYSNLLPPSSLSLTSPAQDIIIAISATAVDYQTDLHTSICHHPSEPLRHPLSPKPS